MKTFFVWSGRDLEAAGMLRHGLNNSIRTVRFDQPCIAPAKALPIQRQWVKWLRDTIDQPRPPLDEPTDRAEELAEAEAVLRQIEIALDEEDYKKTLYKD